MSIDYINTNDLKSSLNDFSQGDFFSLFKLVIKNSYDSYEIIQDKNLILNLISLKQLNNNQDEIVDLIINNRIDLSSLFTPNEEKLIKRNKNYWTNLDLQELPYFFYLIPHLNDENISKLIKQCNFHSLENKKELSEALVIKFFENGFNESLISLRAEYFLIAALDRYENKYKKLIDNKEKEINLEELAFSYFLQNPKLLVAYSEIFFNSIDGCADKWISHKLSEEPQDLKQVSKFIDLNFEKLTEEGKERIISQTLYNTKDTTLIKEALKHLGITKFKDYKPKYVPIWTKSGSHQDKSIYKSLLKSGVNLFDYYPFGNKLFLSVISEDIDKSSIASNLEKIGVNKKEFLIELFSENKTPGIKTDNFSLLLTLRDSKFNEIINFSTDDLTLINKQFKPSNYTKLNLKAKLELIDEILNKTFLAKVYDGEQIYYRKSIVQKEINLNLFIDNEYHLGNFNKNVPHLVKEHFKLLEQINPQDFDSKFDYRNTYFKCILNMFDSYSSQNIGEKSEFYNFYMNIIDYVSTDKNLPWDNILENLNKISESKESFSEGSKIIFNYIHKIALSNTFLVENKQERPKFKI